MPEESCAGLLSNSREPKPGGGWEKLTMKLWAVLSGCVSREHRCVFTPECKRLVRCSKATGKRTGREEVQYAWHDDGTRSDGYTERLINLTMPGCIVSSRGPS